MILDISDNSFKRIMEDDRLALPIRWDGSDFSMTLGSLFSYYISKLESVTYEAYSSYKKITVDVKQLKKCAGY